jgi:NADH-quinone oxidoreductase subunit I
MPYDPGDDVIVIHQPRDNAAAGTFREFAATLKELKRSSVAGQPGPANGKNFFTAK